MYDSQNGYEMIFVNEKLAIMYEGDIVAVFEDRKTAYEELYRLNANN